MTGVFHGAYVRWGKDDLQVSSFETRDYPPNSSAIII